MAAECFYKNGENKEAHPIRTKRHTKYVRLPILISTRRLDDWVTMFSAFCEHS